MPGRANERRSSSVLISRRLTRGERALVGGGVRSCMCGLFGFRAGREQFQQHGVTLALEFFDRAVAGLLQNSLEKPLLNFGAEFSNLPKVFPPYRQRPRELFQEVLHPTWTATQMKQKIGSHNTPPQPWSPTHCRIPVRNIDHALVDEIHDFTIERGLQAKSCISSTRA